MLVFALRLFVEWPYFEKSPLNEYIGRRFERSARVPLPILAAGMLAMIGGVVFLAVDGC